MKVFYKGEEIKIIFILPDNKVDLVIGNRMERKVNHSELMVYLDDYESKVKELEDKLAIIKEIINN